MSRMTQEPENVTDALRWYFGGGLGVAMLSMAAIGMTHRGLDPTGYVLFPRRVFISPFDIFLIGLGG